MNGIVAALLLIEDKNKHKEERIKRKKLRDYSNPLDLAESTFIAQFRLNKDAFCYVLNEVGNYFHRTSIMPILQLATTLRLLAEGSYQRSVGKDSNIALGRSTISKLLTDSINVMEQKLGRKWIKLRFNHEDAFRSKRQFFEQFGFPGIIGCIDGTHIRIIKPVVEESIYFNRKGFYSINAMIMCNYNLEIIFVDACHPGSSHDSFIWNNSNARSLFLTQYYAGERGFWLLGDAGYAVEPFLLTPYRDPHQGSVQHKFNIAHAKARNVVERTIGVLKSRFRCLLNTLPYRPQKVVKLINVCCVLHNICRKYNLDFNHEDHIFEISSENQTNDNQILENSVSLQNEGKRIRDEIARYL